MVLYVLIFSFYIEQEAKWFSSFQSALNFSLIYFAPSKIFQLCHCSEGRNGPGFWRRDIDIDIDIDLLLSACISNPTSLLASSNISFPSRKVTSKTEYKLMCSMKLNFLIFLCLPNGITQSRYRMLYISSIYIYIYIYTYINTYILFLISARQNVPFPFLHTAWVPFSYLPKSRNSTR